MPKIIDRILIDLLERGKSQRECAAYFGVSEAAISKRKKKLGIEIAKNVALEKASRIADEKMDALAQLSKINQAINRELDWAVERAQRSDADRSQLQQNIIHLSAEVRQQLNLQLNILRTLYDVHQVKAFQDSVLRVIGQVSPAVREKIVERLERQHAITRGQAQALIFDDRTSQDGAHSVDVEEDVCEEPYQG